MLNITLISDFLFLLSIQSANNSTRCCVKTVVCVPLLCGYKHYAVLKYKYSLYSMLTGLCAEDKCAFSNQVKYQVISCSEIT